uniref:Uncharacterized protein n=1 Tax=Arundo donax TaxID=35708 RepID=A0A0A9BJW7_ARUDO
MWHRHRAILTPQEGARILNPGWTPLSPITPPTVCDNCYTCPKSTTCCCINEYCKYSFAWGCCLLDCSREPIGAAVAAHSRAPLAALMTTPSAMSNNERAS